jgi:hypothetical protein
MLGISLGLVVVAVFYVCVSASTRKELKLMFSRTMKIFGIGRKPAQVSVKALLEEARAIKTRETAIAMLDWDHQFSTLLPAPEPKHQLIHSATFNTAIGVISWEQPPEDITYKQRVLANGATAVVRTEPSIRSSEKFRFKPYVTMSFSGWVTGELHGGKPWLVLDNNEGYVWSGRFKEGTSGLPCLNSAPPPIMDKPANEMTPEYITYIQNEYDKYFYQQKDMPFEDSSQDDVIDYFSV